VVQRLVTEDKLTATLVLEEIRALGYSGGYSILKRYVRAIRPAATVRVTTRLEHAPGAEGQVDWSPYSVTLGDEQRIVHCFSLVLPFSRYMVVRFALDEKLDTLIRLHEEAFAEIGGIPELMTYDNMTTVGRHVGRDEVWINPEFERYRQQCGFEIHLIDPGQPNQHGSVERPFDYIQNNCLLRRRFKFTEFADLETHGRWWCDHVANVRIHGTTRERPVDRLLRERALLRPLPSCRPEPHKLLARQVGTDFCVAVDTNRYSVPPRHAGQSASIRAFPDRLEILVAGAVVAVHPRASGQHQRLVLPEHAAEFKHFSPSRRLLEQCFLRLGETAHAYYQGLLNQRGRGAGHHMQHILKLADRHGSALVTGAMAHAASYGNYSYQAVARVITGRELPRTGRGGQTAPIVPSPQQVQRWLEGLDVDGGSLAEYEGLIERSAPQEGDRDEQD
jgi:transposase